MIRRHPGLARRHPVHVSQCLWILYKLIKSYYKKEISLKKDHRAQIKWNWFYWPFRSSASVLFASRLPLLYCLDVPYSLVVAARVRVDLSALLWVMFPCVFCHFPIWCPVSEAILDCIDSWSLLSAVQPLITSLDKKLLLILHVLTKEIEYYI